MEKVIVKPGPKLSDYRAYSVLTNLVDNFKGISENLVPIIGDRTIWMINSTAQGGGVAEMLPSQMRIMREKGIKVEWLVIQTDNQHFFDLTKRIHNAIHGSGTGEFSEKDREVYQQVNEENAKQALEYINDNDLVIIHDPQPAGMVEMIKAQRNVQVVWRCHIGLEEKTDVTRGAWGFLQPWLDQFDHFVYSLPEYVPEFIAENYSIIPPAIDPLSHKNRTLHMHKCIGVLHHSGIINERDSIIYDHYDHRVKRVKPDGTLGDPNEFLPLDLIFRPVITQVSRWDRLKGWSELLEAFIRIKKGIGKYKADSIHHKRIEAARLVLAGPDPTFVKDDPEGKAVLDELIETYSSLDTSLQNDIGILLLPMEVAKENALIVNALQRSSSIIVQNSIQEGFGLTATEAMWKQIPILVSNAAGLKFQVQNEINGKVVGDGTDVDILTDTLDEMLSLPKIRERWGFNGRVRVLEKFTVLNQLVSWLDLYAKLSNGKA